MRHAKIVATIGPASSQRAVLHKLISAGVNVIRLNFSHASHADHRSYIRAVRAVAKQLNRPVALVADLQGPKIRVGTLQKKTLFLKRGALVTLTARAIVGNEQCIPIDYPRLPSVVKKGMTILLNEGLVKVRICGIKKTEIMCRVLYGGPLAEHKGVNILNIKLKSFFTAKDKRDLAFALQQGVEYVALSFITHHTDVIRVRRYMRRLGGMAPLIAKIEKPEALKDLGAIIREADGVMVARGDLGIEGELPNVPLWQKRIVAEANEQGKLVIIATQMFESMIHAPMPTRAEVTDVANAIFDATDALMLSGETAIGDHPVTVVRMMNNVIRTAERSKWAMYYRSTISALNDSAPFAVAHGAIDAAREADVKAIVVFTLSGETARLVSKRRPQIPIIALTPRKRTYHQLSLCWGVEPVLMRFGVGATSVVRDGIRKIVAQKLVARGDRVLIVYGSTPQSGGTNTIKILRIGDQHV